jgi:hypothetical protein
MKNYQAGLLLLFGFGISYGTLSGQIQNIILFNSVLSEISLFILAVMCLIMGILSFNYIKLAKSLIYIVNNYVNNFNSF